MSLETGVKNQQEELIIPTFRNGTWKVPGEEQFVGTGSC